MQKYLKYIAIGVLALSAHSFAYAKTAICYFSASTNVVNPSSMVDANTGSSLLMPGDVGIIANNIATRVGGEVMPIKVVELYENNYDAIVNRAGIEKRDQSTLTLATNYDLSDYDVIYLGYPNWWADVPRAIVAFIEQNKTQLEGKTIIPFVSHGGSGESLTTRTIKQHLPSNTTVLEPYVVYYTNVQDTDELEQWLDKVNL